MSSNISVNPEVNHITHTDFHSTSSDSEKVASPKRKREQESGSQKIESINSKVQRTYKEIEILDPVKNQFYLGRNHKKDIININGEIVLDNEGDVRLNVKVKKIILVILDDSDEEVNDDKLEFKHPKENIDPKLEPTVSSMKSVDLPADLPNIDNREVEPELTNSINPSENGVVTKDSIAAQELSLV